MQPLLQSDTFHERGANANVAGGAALHDTRGVETRMYLQRQGDAENAMFSYNY